MSKVVRIYYFKASEGVLGTYAWAQLRMRQLLLWSRDGLASALSNFRPIYQANSRQSRRFDACLSRQDSVVNTLTSADVLCTSQVLIE